MKDSPLPVLFILAFAAVSSSPLAHRALTKADLDSIDSAPSVYVNVGQALGDGSLIVWEASMYTLKSEYTLLVCKWASPVDRVCYRRYARESGTVKDIMKIVREQPLLPLSQKCPPCESAGEYLAHPSRVDWVPLFSSRKTTYEELLNLKWNTAFRQVEIWVYGHASPNDGISQIAVRKRSITSLPAPAASAPQSALGSDVPDAFDRLYDDLVKKFSGFPPVEYDATFRLSKGKLSQYQENKAVPASQRQRAHSGPLP